MCKFKRKGIYVVLTWQLKTDQCIWTIVVGVTLVFRLHVIRLDIYLPSSSFTKLFILLRPIYIIFPLGSFYGSQIRHRASSVGG